MLGGLFVLALTLLAWPLRRKLPERVSVADTYLTVADLLAAAGTDAYEERRQAVTRSLNTSYDLILARRARCHGRSGAMVRLLAQLNVVIPLVEAAPAVHVRRSPLPDAIPAAVRELADDVEESRTGGAEPELPAPDSPSTRAVDSALRHAAAVVRNADAYIVDDRLGRPAALAVRIRRATRSVLLSETSWRYGLRLALCIGLAQALTSLVSVDRSYWVALTVTFVLKPDFGSVFSRAVLRAVGTAAGLVIAAPVLAEVPIGWWDVPVMVLLAPLIPALTVKGYAFQTAAITPVILLLSDLLNHRGVALVQPRLVDSLIGCVIVLVAGYLLWPESWHTRIGHRLADAVTDLADYVGSAFDTGDDGDGVPHPDQAERARARRLIYRDLSSIRSEFQRALTEPPPVGARAAAWLPLVVAIERIVDATTAARVRVNHGAPEPAPRRWPTSGSSCANCRNGCGRPRCWWECAPNCRATRKGCWSRCARRWRRHGRSPHHNRRGTWERDGSGHMCRVPAAAARGCAPVLGSGRVVPGATALQALHLAAVAFGRAARAPVADRHLDHRFPRRRGGLLSTKHSAATGGPTRFFTMRDTTTIRSRPPCRSRTSSPTCRVCAGLARSPLTLTCPARQAAAACERVLVSRTDQIQLSTRTLPPPAVSHRKPCIRL